MTRRPLRVGIVGCGRILPAHLNAYGELLAGGLADVEIVALCSRRLEDVERFLAPGGPPPRRPLNDDAGDPLNAPHVYLSDLLPGTTISGWTDPLTMIDDADLDVVDITASVAAHHQVAMAALATGKHVIVQKPMARTVAEAREMADLACRNGLRLAVMEDMHYQPTVIMARWLVARGALGAIQMAIAAYVGTQPWSPDRIVAGTPWRHRRSEAGGGISLDLGVHFFQQMRRICGPIRSVYGSVRTLEPIRRAAPDADAPSLSVEADVDDTMFCQVEFETGGIGSVIASWAGHGPPTQLPQGLVIYGSKGSLHGAMLHLDGAEASSLVTYFDAHASTAERSALFPYGLVNPFALAYLHFFQAIRDDRDPSYDGREGLLDLTLASAVVTSSETHRPVFVRDVMG